MRLKTHCRLGVPLLFVVPALVQDKYSAVAIQAAVHPYREHLLIRVRQSEMIDRAVCKSDRALRLERWWITQNVGHGSNS